MNHKIPFVEFLQTYVNTSDINFAARELGITPDELRDILAGRKEADQRIYDAFGVKREMFS